jgi:hypothetical protein
MPSRRDDDDLWRCVRIKSKRPCDQCHRQVKDMEFRPRWDSWSGKWLCNTCWAQVAPKYRIPRFDGWE